MRSANKLRSIFPTAPSDKLEIVEIAKITDDHTSALKGVDALIHVASPRVLSGVTNKDILDVSPSSWSLSFINVIGKGAYRGTLGVVETAIDLGIKKIIVTGTMVNLFERKPIPSTQSIYYNINLSMK